MGSKTPSNKVKQDNACDLCELKFQTRQTLRIHKSQIHKHQSQASQQETPPVSDQIAMTKNTSTVPITTPRVSKRLQLKKNSAKDTEESEDSADQNMEEKVNKTSFSCPRCDKMFPIYFQALKHIQKKHCENGDGNPVSPDSPDLIKPVTIERCSNCKQHLSSTHNCTMDVTITTFDSCLFCLKCDEQFQNIALFNKHASNKHNKSVDSMYFKTVEEFTMWKQMAESQVKVKYLALNKSSLKKCAYYQCNYVSPKNEFDKTYLCPSLIYAKECNNGVQIYYIKDHYGHSAPNYNIPPEFTHYLCNKKEEGTFDSLIKKDDDNLYLKLKDLLANISKDAAKLNLSHLKKLFKSALEMQGLLNSFDEDHDDDRDIFPISKSMTDDQIADVLEAKRSSTRLKRKSETRTSVDFKKKKSEVDADSTYNSKSKKDEKSSKIVAKENKGFQSPKVIARSSPVLISPSFNDTYKQFIGEPNEQEKPKKLIKTTKPKEIVKTKMGQFSPKKKPLNDVKPIEMIQKKPNILKPSKINTSFVKDIKYEVREQENDCNILILKI